MEGSGLRRRGNKRTPLSTVLLLVCLFVPSVAHGCQSNEFENDDGICCDMCHAGYKLSETCQGKNQRSNCTKCPPGQYIDMPNYSRNCFRCRKCRALRSEVEISPCNPRQDTICGCMEGYFKSFIDSKTFECVQCKTCKPDESEMQKCLPQNNTVCVCKEKFYRVRGVCQPCKSCTTQCRHLCPHESTSAAPKDDSHFLINIIAGVAAGAGVLFVLIVLITHVVTKRQIKKKLLKPSSQSSDASSHLCEQVLIRNEEPSSSNLETVPPRAEFVEREVSNLPDCVPLEIRTSDLIYTVLDVVPVAQVKQLVRSLNVPDKEIEWAEVDHRCCKEAYYQMLRVWAERGSQANGGGRGGMLHQPLLEELLDKLRLMHLGYAAEKLETKYGFQ